MVAQVVVSVAEGDARDDSVVELMEVLDGRAREIANRLGEVGVVLLVPVGRSGGRHGTDIADTRAITDSVESPQDKNASIAHLGELVLGCANACGLKEVESSGLPGHDVPGIAGVRELRNGEAAVVEPDRGLGPRTAEARRPCVEKSFDGVGGVIVGGQFVAGVQELRQSDEPRNARGLSQELVAPGGPEA